MSDSATKPKKLYKYEAFTEQSLQNLKAQVIYFGSPKNFNDPYDCALVPTIKSPSDSEVESIRASYLNQPLSKKQASEFLKPSIEEFRGMLLRANERAIKTAQEDFVRRGISCFSELNNELLMWSHYGGKYKGFCLEFDTSHQPFGKALKVKYSTEMPHIDPTTLLLIDDFDSVMDLFSTKSMSWSYEKEWRVMHEEAGMAYHYPTECLTGIYFGPEISSEALEIICLVLQGQNPHVRFWKGRRSQTEFKVEFEEFAYTPFLKANSGMVNSKASPTSGDSSPVPNR
jgi:hypothetical protein